MWASNTEIPKIEVTFFFKDCFIVPRCTNAYMNFPIKTVPDTSLDETSDLI